MLKLTPEEKQEELERHRNILLAGNNYLLSKYAGSFVVDNEDAIAFHYEQERLKIEKYFKQGRLDRLEQRLRKLTDMLKSSLDLNFASYINEKTGYEIDLLDDLRKRVDLILSQNEIRSLKEENDVVSMLHYLIETSSKTEALKKLKLLLYNYLKTAGKRKNEYTEVTNRTEQNGAEIVTEIISNGSGPKDYKEFKASSPDGMRRLFLSEWADENQVSTSVTIQFSNGASGPVFNANGICPGIKAFWKNNATVVIEIPENCMVRMQHKEVRSFNDCIVIEYIKL